MMRSLFADATLGERIDNSFRRTVFYLTVTLVYLCVGACIFRYERSELDVQSQRSIEQLELHRAHLLHVLWAETIANTENEWSELAHAKLDVYERHVRAAYQNLPALATVDASGSTTNWSLFSSFFYAYSLLTTIGHGTIYPTSAFIKLFSIVYALVGIPLALLYLTQVGKLLTLLLKAVARKYGTSAIGSFDRSEQFNVGARIAVALVAALLVVGAILFDLVENSDEDMSFVDALFAVFLTTTTIGSNGVERGDRQLQMLHMTYSLVSLSVSSMCFVALQTLLEQQLLGFELKFNAVWAMVVQLAERTTNDRQRADGAPMSAKLVEEDEDEDDDN